MIGNIGVAAVGDVLNVNTWSNIPFYFYQEGLRSGLFNQPWAMDPERMKWLRYAWNLKQVMLARGSGGFQYSVLFLEQAEAQIPAHYFSSTVISFNQVFPRATTVTRAGGKMYYYIDTTLYDLFNEPDYGITIPSAMKDMALAQEKRNYENAEAVVVMGEWVKTSLVSFYGVATEKIRQILPGANIDLPADFNSIPFSPGAGVTRDLVLGFVGKDWKRKGLDLLLDVRDELVRQGYRVRVKAIGVAPEELMNREGIDFTGFIDKHTNAAKFINEIAACDLGCLLSSTEALGISTLEFLRVGVPVMGFYHQGMKDTLIERASVRLKPGMNAREIAERVEALILNQAEGRRLKEKSIEISADVTWASTIQNFRKLL